MGGTGTAGPHCSSSQALDILHHGGLFSGGFSGNARGGGGGNRHLPFCTNLLSWGRTSPRIFLGRTAQSAKGGKKKEEENKTRQSKYDFRSAASGPGFWNWVAMGTPTANTSGFGYTRLKRRRKSNSAPLEPHAYTSPARASHSHFRSHTFIRSPARSLRSSRVHQGSLEKVLREKGRYSVPRSNGKARWRPPERRWENHPVGHINQIVVKTQGIFHNPEPITEQTRMNKLCSTN